MRRLRILASATAGRAGDALAAGQGLIGVTAVGVGCYLRFSLGTALIVLGALLLAAAYFQTRGGVRR